MDDILSRRTTMRIRRVEDGMALEPDTIYLIPQMPDDCYGRTAASA